MDEMFVKDSLSRTVSQTCGRMIALSMARHKLFMSLSMLQALLSSDRAFIEANVIWLEWSIIPPGWGQDLPPPGLSLDGKILHNTKSLADQEQEQAFLSGLVPETTHRAHVFGSLLNGTCGKKDAQVDGHKLFQKHRSRQVYRCGLIVCT